MEVYIVGEDTATQEIIKRVLYYSSDKFSIIKELPARGGKIKNKEIISKFNILAAKRPVILLLDLDNISCAPDLLHNLFYDFRTKNTDFIINIAIDEAEAWLMADREGFSRYFSVPIDCIPKSVSHSKRQKKVVELSFPYKSSIYMMREIIPKSSKHDIKQKLTPIRGAKKGPEYNSTIESFIRNEWDIDNARKNSNSLQRMINRLNLLIKV